MSDIPGRLYRVAKAYLDAARGRLEDIDAQAQAELRRSLGDEEIIPDPPPRSSDDPYERAAAKIAAAQQAVAARRAVSPAPESSATTTPAPAPSDPVQTAYKIIGVPSGSDFATVRDGVNKLRERCAPSRFPDGSEMQAEAQVILQRVEEAYHVLKNALDPTEGRFDRLEI